jgi:hypothetical protein
MTDDKTEALARAFANRLLGELGHTKMREINARNETYGPTVCASHDFCDSNMTMLAAGQDLKFWTDSDDIDDDLWNEAWDHAKRNKFWH